MKVEIKKDSTDIFPHLYEGSVLQSVTEKGKNYHGIFTSMFGSYYVEVPKKRCRKYKEGQTINDKIDKWLKKNKLKRSDTQVA